MVDDGLSIIYARSSNRCIGNNGQLPWRLPDEYAHFDQTTIGLPNIMGRRSFEDHDGALAGRLNIVVSGSMESIVSKEIHVVRSLGEALTLTKQQANHYFVIGGAGLIAEALPLASTVLETIVDSHIDGDTFLPAFDFSAWTTSMIAEHPTDDRHAYAYQVLKHQRVT